MIAGRTPDLEAARALHDELVVTDLHADTPKLIEELGYDLSRRHRTPSARVGYFGHVDVPRMREGGLGAQFFGLWTFPLPRAGCADSVHRQLDALDDACARDPAAIVRCLSHEDVLAARASGRIAALAGIEGGHALEGKLHRVEEFARRGVRYLGLLHFSVNEIGFPAKGLGRDDSRGLTPFGARVVEELDRVGMILDLAHINRRGFFEALEVSRSVPHPGRTPRHSGLSPGEINISLPLQSGNPP
jgi:membrane dipeptidase